MIEAVAKIPKAGAEVGAKLLRVGARAGERTMRGLKEVGSPLREASRAGARAGERIRLPEGRVPTAAVRRVRRLSGAEVGRVTSRTGRMERGGASRSATKERPLATPVRRVRRRGAETGRTIPTGESRGARQRGSEASKTKGESTARVRTRVETGGRRRTPSEVGPTRRRSSTGSAEVRKPRRRRETGTTRPLREKTRAATKEAGPRRRKTHSAAERTRRRAGGGETTSPKRREGRPSPRRRPHSETAKRMRQLGRERASRAAETRRPEGPRPEPLKIRGKDIRRAGKIHRHKGRTHRLLSELEAQHKLRVTHLETQIKRIKDGGGDASKLEGNLNALRSGEGARLKHMRDRVDGRGETYTYRKKDVRAARRVRRHVKDLHEVERNRTYTRAHNAVELRRARLTGEDPRLLSEYDHKKPYKRGNAHHRYPEGRPVRNFGEKRKRRSTQSPQHRHFGESNTRKATRTAGELIQKHQIYREHARTHRAVRNERERQELERDLAREELKELNKVPLKERNKTWKKRHRLAKNRLSSARNELPTHRRNERHARRTKNYHSYRRRALRHVMSHI